MADMSSPSRDETKWVASLGAIMSCRIISGHLDPGEESHTNCKQFLVNVFYVFCVVLRSLGFLIWSLNIITMQLHKLHCTHTSIPSSSLDAILMAA